MLIIIRVFENGEWRYEVDVVVMQFGFVVQRRSFSFGEGVGG